MGRSGFSLIELLVVISISAVLLSIGAVAGLKIQTEMRRTQTRTMMKGLLGAQEEFKARRQIGPVEHDNASGQFPDGATSTERFVAAMRQVPTAETAMITAINTDRQEAFDRQFRDFKGATGIEELYDRWDIELAYRRSNNANDGGTGPARGEGSPIPNSDLPSSPNPFFVSAGPDKEFGTADDITTLQD